MKNKKKTKILFIILPILVLLIIAATIGVLYFTTDMFRSNKELFAKYFAENERLINLVENSNLKEQKLFKKSNTYTSNGNLLVTVQNGSNTQEAKAVTSSRHDATTGRTYAELILKNGENDLLKASYINSGDVYAVKCDDIIGNYIGIRNTDLQAFAKNMGSSDEEIKNMPNSIDIASIANMSNLTEEQKKHIKDTYFAAILENVPEISFKKVRNTVTINDVVYDANGYAVTLTPNTIRQILLNCLAKLKEDNTTLTIISNKLSDLGLSSEYTDITKMLQFVNDTMTEVQNSDMNNVGTIIVTVYESKGKNIETVIEIVNKSKIIIDNASTDSIDKEIITIENSGHTLEQSGTSNEIYNTASMINTVNNTTIGNNISNNINNSVASNIVENTTIDELNSIVENITNDATTNTTQDAVNNSTNNALVAEETASTQISQIILQKTTSVANIVNEITIIPDISNKAQMFIFSANMRKAQNNEINNVYNITINNSSDGINVQNINASYEQNIQLADQVEEIMELKNSNTIIVNNYNKEQLIPFLNSIVNKIEQVIPNKIAQLGIAIH